MSCHEHPSLDLPFQSAMVVELRVVEEHSECLYFIQRLLARGKLPLAGFGMIHYDSHPDLWHGWRVTVTACAISAQQPS